MENTPPDKKEKLKTEKTTRVLRASGSCDWAREAPMGGDARAMEGLKEKSRQPIGEFSPNTGYMSAGMWDKWNNNFIHTKRVGVYDILKVKICNPLSPAKGVPKGLKECAWLEMFWGNFRP